MRSPSAVRTGSRASSGTVARLGRFYAEQLHGLNASSKKSFPQAITQLQSVPSLRWGRALNLSPSFSCGVITAHFVAARSGLTWADATTVGPGPDR